MRNMLAFLAAAVLVLAGVGWYLDWFKLSSRPSSDGHQSVTIDVNTNKLGSDVKTAVEKGEAMIDKEKAALPKADAAAVDINGKGIQMKSKSLDVSVPIKEFQFPQR